MMRSPLQELLARLYLQFATEFEERMARAGFEDITLAHGANVLRYVDEDGVRIGTIAHRAGLSKQAISQQVKYLETHGYVSVHPDPSDQRSKLVRNTRRGRHCRAVARPLFTEIERAWARRAGWDLMSDLRASLELAVDALVQG